MMLSFRIMALALAMRESGGNPSAVNGDCVGLHQMKVIMVHECNRIAGYEKYSTNDRLDPKLSSEMCELKLNHTLGKGNWTIRDACLLWREGDKGRFKHAKDHEQYIKDVTKYYGEIRNGKIDTNFSRCY
jgi:hypothetical protein